MMPPTHAQFELTERCNNLCTYCYNSWKYDLTSQPPRTASPDSAKQIVQKLIDYDLFVVIFTGGEPLLEKDTLLDCAYLCSSNNVTPDLNSNLTLMTMELAAQLKSAGVNKVMASFTNHDQKKHDAITQRRGSFDEAVKGMEYSMAAGIDVVPNMVIMKGTVADVYKTGEFLHKKIGIKNFNGSPIAPESADIHAGQMLSFDDQLHVLDQLLALEKDYGINVRSVITFLPCMLAKVPERDKYVRFMEVECQGGSRMISVSPDGGVRTCPPAWASHGNILEENLEQILDKMHCWRVAPEDTDSLVPEECRPCVELSNCKGGCRIEACVMTGSLNGKNPYMREPLKEKLNWRPEIPSNDYTNSAVSFKGGLKLRSLDDGTHEAMFGNYIMGLTQPELNLLQALSEKERVDVQKFCSEHELDPSLVNVFLNRLNS
ncbi:radical SAM protein, partial [Candidatus Woesearchaeota archaeon]|nr:radical SAM protein [Candidatus Woesearchaeota archaeon]